MKTVLAALVCLAAAAAAFSQTAETNGAEPPAKITLAKKEKDGTVKENPDRFGSRDVPIICYVDLANEEPVEVKLVVVAVKAEGLRPDSGVVTIRYKTAQGENMVTFTAKPKDVWAPGNYRADVYLDGVASASEEFIIEKE